MAASANLGEGYEDFLDGLVREGRFASREDALRDGVRLMQEREARLTELKAHIQAGIDDCDAGRSLTADAAFDELDAYIKGLIEKKAA